MKNLMALMAEAGDGDGGGGGAPAGGSPEGGQDDKLKDGETVPRTQLIAALNSAERKYESQLATMRAEFDAKLEAQIKAKPADSPKRYTRVELNAAVEAGQVSRDQADAELDRQAREEVSRVALETVNAAEGKRFIDSEIARYKAVAPEILDDAHDTRKKIREEFAALVKVGDDPNNVVTQWKAIRSVLGSVDRLEKARSGIEQHEFHRETGGGGGGREGGGKPAFEATLTQRERAHYQRLITSGTYKDWAEVEAEMKYAKPAIRRKQGATV